MFALHRILIDACCYDNIYRPADLSVDSLFPCFSSIMTRRNPLFLAQVISLTPRFARSAQLARVEAQGQSTAGLPGADEEDDEDTMKGMARLFAEVGEAFTSMIAQGEK